MAYEMYMGNILCPVTPSKIELKIKNQNKTMNLVNGTEVNVLKDAGLTEISYDLLLPNVKYSFATYKNEFVNAKYFLDEFEKMKIEKKPFIFKLLRTFPTGVALYNTDDMMVSLESYTIKEDASQGFDVVVSIKLKQFKSYGTKIVKVLDGSASVEQSRETSNSPMPSDNPVTTYTVVNGDCLWNIAKKFYGDGSKYYAIYEANKDKIANPSLIYAGQVLTIPGANQIKSTSFKKSTSPGGSTSPNGTSNTNDLPVGFGSTKLLPVECEITFNFDGSYFYMGSVGIEYTHGGKLFNVTKMSSGKITVDTGTVVKMDFGKSKFAKVAYMFFTYSNTGRTETISYLPTNKRDMTANSNTVVNIIWKKA